MQWSITGSVVEADGKPASGRVQAQIYDIPRKQWRVLVQANLDANGRFSMKVSLVPGGQALPAMRLCEPGTPLRVLAEGGLVQLGANNTVELSFGQIQRLGDSAVARSDRNAPFSQADDYLLAGVPRPPQPAISAASLRMASPAMMTVTQPQAQPVQPNAEQVRINADLSKRVELQEVQLNEKQLQMIRLEQEKNSTADSLRLANQRIAALESQLKAQPASSTVDKGMQEQVTLATEKLRLSLNEQLIRQSSEFDIRAMDLQRTINLKNEDLLRSNERIVELSKLNTQALEEAARAKAEAEQLKQQLNSQVNAGDLYASIGKQLQQAQSALDEEAVPYRLGKVSLNLKTLVSGNQLVMPTMADLGNQAAAGMFTDVKLEFVPGSIAAADAGLVSVPDFSDLTETLARRLAHDLGLELEAAWQSVGDSGQSIGQAIRQLPAKGTQVAPGSSIMVVFTQA